MVDYDDDKIYVESEPTLIYMDEMSMCYSVGFSLIKVGIKLIIFGRTEIPTFKLEDYPSE
jgi:hypothetical protein